MEGDAFDLWDGLLSEVLASLNGVHYYLQETSYVSDTAAGLTCKGMRVAWSDSQDKSDVPHHNTLKSIGDNESDSQKERLTCCFMC
jgi:hypothetical protein